LALGACLEFNAYLRSMKAGYAAAYGYSAGLLKASEHLRGFQGPLRLLTELNNDSAAAERFLLLQGGLRSRPEGAAVALLPWDYARGLEKEGRLLQLQASPEAQPLLLFWPSPRALARLESVEAALSAYWRDLPPYQGGKERQLAAAWLRKNPAADPWLRSVYFERALGQALMAGELPLELVAMMEGAELQSVSGLIWAAQKLRQSDPARAGKLARRAIRLDPRRGDARALAAL
jgi:hypothetical protein